MKNLSIIVLKNDVPICRPKILLILINETKHRHADQLFLIRHIHIVSHSTCSRKSPIHYGPVHVRTHRFIDLGLSGNTRFTVSSTTCAGSKFQRRGNRARDNHPLNHVAPCCPAFKWYLSSFLLFFFFFPPIIT